MQNSQIFWQTQPEHMNCIDFVGRTHKMPEVFCLYLRPGSSTRILLLVQESKSHEPDFISIGINVYSFIPQWHCSPLLGPGLFILTRAVGLLGRGISSSQGRYLHPGQHRINAHTDLHASSGIRTHYPSVRASEEGSYLRPHGHCDRPLLFITLFIFSSIPLWWFQI
jgi:hypothetical protein